MFAEPRINEHQPNAWRKTLEKRSLTAKGAYFLAFLTFLALVGVCSFGIFRMKIAEMHHIQSHADWKQLYEAALLETDSTRLPEKIILARRAIFERIEESLREPVASEHHAMNEALRHLRRLAEMAAPSLAA